MDKIANVFEWGSGESTIFWLENNKVITSIEHDSSYFNWFQAQVANSPNLDYRLIEAELDTAGSVHDSSSPENFHSEDMVGYQFKSYIESINAYPDSSFDVVVVDGRARSSAIVNATPKIRPGGMLILDNSNRKYYLSKTSECLDGWAAHIFLGTVRGLMHKEQTTIYIKPLSDKRLS